MMTQNLVVKKKKSNQNYFDNPSPASFLFSSPDQNAIDYEVLSLASTPLDFRRHDELGSSSSSSLHRVRSRSPSPVPALASRRVVRNSQYNDLLVSEDSLVLDDSTDTTTTATYPHTFYGSLHDVGIDPFLLTDSWPLAGAFFFSFSLCLFSSPCFFFSSCRHEPSWRPRWRSRYGCLVLRGRALALYR